MMRLGLLGKNISHSKSPLIYRQLLDVPFTYDLLDFQSEVEIPSLNDLSKKYFGINITAPYKKHFLSQLILDENAKRIGAVNCIRFDNDKYFATNTDFDAFKTIFLKKNYHRIGEIILLGDGAMANMTKIALSDLNCRFFQFSRKTHGDLNQIDYCAKLNSNSREILFVNCCSRDFTFKSQIHDQWNDKTVSFFDLNYSNENQKNLCVEQGFSYYDGYELLIEQARLATVFWSTI